MIFVAGTLIAEPGSDPINERDLKMNLAALGRFVGAGVIVVIFVIVLLTASAQQEVLRRLAAIDSSLDYSSAYVIKGQVDQSENDARTAAKTEQLASEEASKASDAADTANGNFEEAWQPFTQEIRTLSRGGKCELSAQAADAMSLAARGQVITTLEDCTNGSELSSAQASKLRTTLNAQGGIVAPYQNALRANSRLSAANSRLARAQKQTQSLAQLDSKNKRIADSFDETSKLRSSWYLGDGLLIDLPPALLQIILSFVSGIFGALLITLVLIVYPNTKFTVASKSGYEARTFLGGLIALCVYVVLNGGSAVLGTAATVATGNNNYMAFCAIGILAGMFSDRVAAWLSKSADQFFKADENEAVDPDAQEPPPAAG